VVRIKATQEDEVKGTIKFSWQMAAIVKAWPPILMTLLACGPLFSGERCQKCLAKFFRGVYGCHLYPSRFSFLMTSA
jgi:hypothetical protein